MRWFLPLLEFDAPDAAPASSSSRTYSLLAGLAGFVTRAAGAAAALSVAESLGFSLLLAFWLGIVPGTVLETLLEVVLGVLRPVALASASLPPPAV